MAILEGATVATAHSRYELGRKLGQGHHAVVHEAVNLQSGARLASKVQPVPKNQRVASMLMQELSIHKLLSSTAHPNILPLTDVAQQNDTLYIFLPQAKCDLFALVEQTGGFSEDIARAYATELLSALDLCHSNNIFHRDVKPENVLVHHDGHLQLADFGFACVAQPDQNLVDRVGTPAYVAPEILSNTDYLGGPADVWSLGVVLFIMVACCFPFETATEKCVFYKSLVQGRFKFPEKMSPELCSLLLCIWEVDPRDRLSLEQIREHEWFTTDEMNQPAPEVLRSPKRARSFERGHSA